MRVETIKRGRRKNPNQTRNSLLTRCLPETYNRGSNKQRSDVRLWTIEFWGGRSLSLKMHRQTKFLSGLFIETSINPRQTKRTGYFRVKRNHNRLNTGGF